MIALFRTKSVPVTKQCVRYALPIASQTRSLSVRLVNITGATQSSIIPTGNVLQRCSTTAFTHDWSHRNVIQNSRFSSNATAQKQKQSPTPPSSNNYLWIALAAAIGGIGLAYIVYGSGDEDSTKRVNVPPTSKEIPSKVPYLLIGGGTASFAAFRAIKSHDPKAKVMVITRENQMPYMRPPLSKEIWRNSGSDLKFKQWNGAERSLFFEPEDFYIDPTQLLESPNGGVAIVRGYTVKSIDVAAKKAILSDGTEIEYDECLLATGSEPENLPIFRLAPPAIQKKVSVFKTIDDFVQMKEVLDKSDSVAIIGGGFLGSELACALAKYRDSKKLTVHQVFNENGNMGKILPQYLSEWSTERVKEEGVNVIPNTQVKNVELVNAKVKLDLLNNKSLLVDHVIVAVGSRPDVQLAEDSGLEVDGKHGGYLVNAELEARRHLFVAGDAACFFDIKLGRRRVEHHDHAVVSGRLAGENMVGKKKPFTHQSMFWSDLGPNVGYEAIGLVDATLPTIGVFAKHPENDTNAVPVENVKTSEGADATPNADQVPSTATIVVPPKTASDMDNYSKGVVFYMKDEKVVGIVLWNIFNRINVARSIIAEGRKYDDLNEVAKLFEIHA
ncbi:putative apoptosis-inducing factor 1, mitochondrial isoform X2 [Bradysia coprophila]|uniref:putative apoptosis-inducing factor 1, mitochondrial isoform X2 n=1 Tax=Bradysia coprophila TaxID=38358 RepID=UPI00187DB404|nr:putative apoptosis-inducing factor 1, mitochondrial isoform X2 [Bradysia coprophila]